MMTKVLLTLLTLALSTDASAQSRAFYDRSGRAVGRSSTDSQGTVTNYDARGRVIRRETPAGSGTTTFYDVRGHVSGRTSKDRGLPPCDRASGVCYPK
jgi:YD repeat-containing protein